MGSASSGIMNLRPVIFQYKNDESKSTQFGLIAEEVAEVVPDLVIFDKDNNPESVKYHLMAPMLLNEIQKLEARIAELESKCSK